MKSLISGLLVAFSMYSAIPVPQVNWEKKTMRWTLIFLPLVGVVISAIQWIWFMFCRHFDANMLFFAVGATLIPLCISGGIHLDGLCDTCDALCSFGDREKRLAILKDPHVGAFGPMWISAFFLAECGCFAQIYAKSALFPVVLCGFALARTMGGRKVVASPCAKDSGLAHIFAENSDKKMVSCVLCAEFIIILLLFIWLTGHVITAAVLAVLLIAWYGIHERLSIRTFGGITGDLAGFCISISELLCLVVAAVGGLVL